MNTLLWGVLPYLVFLVLVGGTIWRYRYDQFGWTTRSTQLYESRMLRIGSPLFHFGILFVLVGHIVGLLIPISWTRAVGVTQEMYHLGALSVGSIAGFATLVGLAILIYRRRTTGPVFLATTNNDKTMYVVLVAAIVLGLFTTVISVVSNVPEHNYRLTVSPWFRSLFWLSPRVDAMAAAPWTFKTHVLVAFLLFAMWPFTRLVHAFTAPLHYLFRPYIVYRSRDVRPSAGATAIRRGWTPVGTRDTKR